MQLSLDGPTIVFTTTLTLVTLGLMLIYNSTPRRGDPSVRFWGLALLLGAMASWGFHKRGEWEDIWTIDAANALVIFAYGLLWCGIRLFANRRILYGIALAGPVLWLAACQIAPFYDSATARITLSSTLNAGYLIAASWELIRLREALSSKIPLVGFFLLHAAITLARLPAAAFRTLAADTNLFHTPWVMASALESSVFHIASCFLLLSLAKERSEHRLQRLAALDSLTEISNRRDFMGEAARLLRKARRAGKPCAVLMIDLDHFKKINDESGHQAGDEVLRSVAMVMKANVKPADLCGRIGGEEFACLLMDCTLDEALGVAERLRRAVSDMIPRVTISIGCASTDHHPLADLDTLIAVSDRALYASKNAGRNRVTAALAA